LLRFAAGVQNESERKSAGGVDEGVAFHGGQGRHDGVTGHSRQQKRTGTFVPVRFD
jgi:hypothetical protein